MKPYDRITIVRNRLRARDLHVFRARVQSYFDQLELGAENNQADWDGIQADRAEINRMLPRIVWIVQAADLGALNPRAVEIIQHLLSDRYGPGAYQEILDVLDQAVGVYDANRFGAFTRTINPLHYVVAALGFVASVPRRALLAIGILRPRIEKTALSPAAGTEKLIDARVAAMREGQSRALGDHTNQIMELAERVDFLERVLAQQRSIRLEPPEKQRATPE